MEKESVFQVMCRDGIMARVQRVAYQGLMECEVYFGKRFPPDLAPFDRDGMANESGDLWTLDGFWNMVSCPHPFDIIRGLEVDRDHNPIGLHAHG